MSRKLITFAWGLVLLLATCAAAVAPAAPFLLVSMLMPDGFMSDTYDAPSPADVEGYGGVRLPPDVSDLRARVRIVMTHRYCLARFSIARGELADLLASGGFRVLPPGTAPDWFSVVDEPDWWKPDVARATLTAQAGPRGAILVQTEGPDRYVVYLSRMS
jgi:hypothetical protein